MKYEIIKYYINETIDNARKYRNKPIVAYWVIVGILIGCFEILTLQLELWRSG